jgi:predicted DNA-binding transcriptional regulator AlpA
MKPHVAETPINAREAAVAAGLALSTFLKQVAAERMPAPFYPAPRAPRWYPSEIKAALEATRARPVEAKEARRHTRLNLPK